ncbi:MarR family transcriptional regulator [Paenibacillus sp. UMB4589-SE434]|uniref:MarR family winged helix-turn-helix transcriptional regulator n=1 Tax=Paenibacillus sp. UMB4589-SE434 TaxID=3046314 RepID=UPI00254E457A|nr:MarR family transcriptional regulator [Paenibacillus sp. UMB4589-SE434]MDK8183481.1 MarR family transcriptional regulator [Paenibacillus sp. UMB4589-SE434]
MSEQAQLLELPALFKRLVKRLTQEWKRQMHEEMSMNQFRLLFVLHSTGPKKANELADIVCVTAGAITGMTDKLVERGYVERRRNKEDRRVVSMQLTEAGQRFVDDVLNRQNEVISALFGMLPHEDVKHLKRIFTVMLNRLEPSKEE